jgi:hypothetical protein
VSDDSKEIPAWERDGVMQIPVRAGEWVKVEFWGYMSRSGAADGATVYLRVEADPLRERLAGVMGFTEVRDLSLEQGKRYEGDPDALPPSLRTEKGEG